MFEFFLIGFEDPSTDNATKQVLPEKIKQYEDRSRQIEEILAQQMSTLNLSNEADSLIAKTVDKSKINQNISSSLGLDPTTDVSKMSPVSS